jgi:putative oxidoreductase
MPWALPAVFQPDGTYGFTSRTSGQHDSMSIGTLAIRGVAGPLFVGHGTQKLFGWFGGHGLEGTGGFFESIGMRPGKRHATAAGVAEALGGALLTVGALTPLAAAMISGSMVTAIRKVHAPHGPWVTDNGWEYNALILATMVSVSEQGPGPLSIDRRLFPNFKGTACAIAALGAAVAGSYVIDALSEDAPDAEGATANAGPGAGTPDGEAGVAQDPASTPSGR